MADIKPIETFYSGYRFRSRLEARWAVFFDALGIYYEYEHQGYTLPGGSAYLPDFWLPQTKNWVEIKARWPDRGSTELDRLEEFASVAAQINAGECEKVPSRFLIFVGRPWHSFESCFDVPNLGQEYVVVSRQAGRFACTSGQWAKCPQCRIYDVFDVEVSLPREDDEPKYLELVKKAGSKGYVFQFHCRWCQHRFDNPQTKDELCLEPEDFGDEYAWHVPGDLCGWDVRTWGVDSIFGEELQDAYAAARSARFEHGETPRGRTARS